MDISRPDTVPGFKLPEAANGVEWVQFSYENLPRCRFKCGFIGHHQASCNIANLGFKCGTPPHIKWTAAFEMYNPKQESSPSQCPDRPVSARSLLNQV
ncbi:hypothetical protein IFM89_010765 [Coptis chinensis]|uniref:Zinc knuckle CX2CX4HX4C domain-containing protein n=1 Tax=Coptis chinensis TaxID=261450 RepID=A0A835ILN8_9MAGN|nr:hypothetical protein IFM89_010765 [Coptis chinensis]